MANQRKTTVAVLFGGRSVEHDVSIVTGQQIMQAFDRARYEVVPVYITRDGKWYTGDALFDIKKFEDEAILNQPDVQPVLLSPDVRHHGLIINPLPAKPGMIDVLRNQVQTPQVKRLDVAFPAIHGSHGEDGTLQGLFELADIPYVGFATLGSALTNDKILTKQILQQNDIPVVPGVAFSRADWLDDADGVLQRIMDTLAYPVFIKPATLGSSIGVNRANDEAMLRASIDVAVNFDRRVLVEQAVTGGVEINCAVMGYRNAIQTSVLEQPLSWSDFLGFEDKYLRGDEGMKSADRIIPAPLDDDLTAHIQNLSVEAFKAVDGRGIVRIDYLVKPDEHIVYLNEMNTMPGSLSFYLWREVGLSPAQVVDKLVELAHEAHADKRRNMYDYKTNLVNVAAARGTKGSKGTKSTPQEPPQPAGEQA